MTKVNCISAVILVILAWDTQQASSSEGGDMLFFRPDLAAMFHGDCREQRHAHISHKTDDVDELNFSEDYKELAC
ncbi:unnamed protein product, partial [Adineta steineri]